MVLLTSHPAASELRATLLETFSKGGMAITAIEIKDDSDASLSGAAAQLQKTAPQAVVIDMSHEGLRRLGELESERRFSWPAVLATVSAGTLTQLTQEIRSRVIGFISVVPNPEDNRIALIRNLSAQAEQHAGPEAMTFEGVEAYVNLAVAVEAIRKSGANPTPQAVMRATTELQQVGMGNFTVQLNLGRGGPTWTDVGLRSRDGSFVR